ncbi:MAG: MFS transporter [Alphaproteobacteria bacterium]|nr:MFS transporter [Alphaproteobacteria bacterium]
MVALVVFAQTIFTRAVDPVIPMIAADLAIDVKTAALLSTAFAFPYALIQPVLGVTGDFFGRTKLMNACVLVMALASLVCVFATNFTLLVAMRIVAGLVAGGVFPVAMALLGDLVPINQRQVAIARLLGIALTANVLGASIAGVIGDLFGWRGVFGILGTFSLVVAVLAFWALRNTTLAKPPPFSRAAVIANFRGVFADPRAKFCFGAVFFEAIFIHGLFPYVGVLLMSIGETRASIAGLLIACFAIGGILYSIGVPYLVRAIPQGQLMLIGGAIAGVGLALLAAHLSWQVQMAVYGSFGLGFYLLHSCIQVHVTDLSQTARGAAASLHSSSFYLGQAIGPVVYGFGFDHGGPEPTILFGGVVVAGIGLVCSQTLRRRV